MSVERDGYNFYTTAAAHASNEKGKRMFLDLAHQEVDHLRLMLAEYRSLEAGEGWLPYEEAMAQEFELDPAHPDLPGEEPEDPLPVFTPAREPSMENDIAALKFGLETEEISRELYVEGAEKAEDANARQAYQFLVRQEEKHYELLQNTYEYLTENWTWWDDNEYPFFTG
jgi:rubrerythrin